MAKRKLEPREIYREILAGVTSGFEQRVAEILSYHVGSDNRITSEDLVRMACYGYGSLTRPTDADDRRVRKAIANLQEAGLPILSDSGQGGRWIASEGEIDAYIAELESRRSRLAEKVAALRKAKWQMEQGQLATGSEPELQPKLF